MSRTLSALMRLKRLEMDNLRNEMNRLADAVQRTIATIEEVNRHRVLEKTAMLQNLHNIQFVSSYHIYSRNAEQELIRLHDIKQRQEKALEKIQDQMRDLFADYKKYDIIKENNIAREKYDIKKNEDFFLDDIAGQRATRGY